MHALAVEVWTTNAGIHFDNFVVTHRSSSGPHSSALKDFTESTFTVKSGLEEEKSKKEKKVQRAEEEAIILDKGNISEKVKVYVGRLADFLAENPLALVGTIGAVLVAFFYLIIFGGKEAVKVDEEVDGEGEVVEGKEGDKKEDDSKSEDKKEESKEVQEKENTSEDKKEE